MPLWGKVGGLGWIENVLWDNRCFGTIGLTLQLFGDLLSWTNQLRVQSEGPS